MKVTLSFEETISNDVSIMVDVLRASTTITEALTEFKEIIPCFTPEEAFKLKSETGGVIAGERKGAKVEGFDIGNSPNALKDFKTDSKTIEDFLASGEIIYQIYKNCSECEIDEYAKSAVLASRDYNAVQKAFYESTSGNKLKSLGYEKDIGFSLNKNSTKNVGKYDGIKINKVNFK